MEEFSFSRQERAIITMLLTIYVQDLNQQKAIMQNIRGDSSGKGVESLNSVIEVIDNLKQKVR